MKTLYIVRHAKSSWDHSGISDHDRPLMEKGKKKTRRIVDYLLLHKVEIDLIISSDAVRARETAFIIARGISYPDTEIRLSSSIYNCGTDDLFRLLDSLADDIGSLMIVGHNPSMTDFANIFLEDIIYNMPTSGVACIEFNTDKWADIRSAAKKTNFVISPKTLKKEI
jgi:phosphohistidine phosphatase